MSDERIDRYGKCPQYKTEQGTIVGGTWSEYDAFIDTMTAKAKRKHTAKKIVAPVEEAEPEVVEEPEQPAEPKERIYFGKYKKLV